jgi:hypothetical protein
MTSDNSLTQFLDATIQTNLNRDDIDLFNHFLTVLRKAISDELKSKLKLVYPTFLELDPEGTLGDRNGYEGEYALVTKEYEQAFDEYQKLISNDDVFQKELTEWRSKGTPLWIAIKFNQWDRKSLNFKPYFNNPNLENLPENKPTILEKDRSEPQHLEIRKRPIENFNSTDLTQIEGDDINKKFVNFHRPLMVVKDQHVYYFISNNSLGSDSQYHRNGFLKLLVSTSSALTKKEISFFLVVVRTLFYQRKLAPLLKQHKLRTAIISILVDSYAHNISAHSLVAIENWVRKRSQVLERPLSIKENNNDIRFPNNVISHQLLQNFSGQSEQYYKLLGLSDQTNSSNFLTIGDIIRLRLNNSDRISTLEDVLKAEYPTPVLKQGYEKSVNNLTLQLPVPIDYILWPFMRFLKGKAAFWSGVTRDLPFGGQHISLHKILYNEFASNALYVGTISATEGIHKLNIRIGLDPCFGNAQQSGTTDSNTGKITFYDYLQINTELLDSTPGIPANEAETGRTDSKKQRSKSRIEAPFELEESINYSQYGFIRLGKDFNQLRKILDTEIAFLPARIVGLHSFITIIENSIRNVKHYRHCLSELKKNGLNLVLTFEKMDLFNLREGKKLLYKRHEYTGQHRFYRIGVALGHEIDKGKNPLDAIIDKLSNKIIEVKTGQASLGGTSQDKICSSMLVTNKFINVENVQSRLDYFYYPWTHPILLDGQDLESGNTFEAKLTDTLRKNVFDKSYFSMSDKNSLIDGERSHSQKKYFFKFFNVWKSGEVTEHNSQIGIPGTNNLEFLNKIFKRSDNSSRFKLLIVNDLSKYIDSLVSRAEERNIFRVQERTGSLTGEASYLEIYKSWNLAIFDPNSKVSLFELSGQKLTPRIIYHIDGQPKYPDLSEQPRAANSSFFPGDLSFSHNPQNQIPETFKNIVLKYRSHGVLMEEFSIRKDDPFEGIIPEKTIEFLETILLPVKIWDERLHQRVKSYSEDTLKFENSLHLNIYGETDEDASYFNNKSKPDGQIGATKPSLTIYVVHLSYINELNKGASTNIRKVDWFIETYLSHKIIHNAKREINKTATFYSFCLCIVSGRGNAEWYSNEISDKYIPYVIYKPIESLLNAVTDAMEFHDDFQLKYNICKTLIG